MKRILLPIFILLWLASLVSAASSDAPPSSDTVAADAGSDYVVISQINGRELAVNLTTCDVRIRDTHSGTDWHTLPPGLDGEAGIGRDMKNQMSSQLVVTYLNSARNEVTVNSSACVGADTYEIAQTAKGIRITYDFAGEGAGFKIPVEFALTEDFLRVTLLYDRTQEYGAARITGIDLLPWFGAGRADEPGYLLLPDGSGALADFADNDRDAEDWRRPVYGNDPAADLMLKSVDPGQTVRMPVFGIKKSDAAVLAVIEKGDAAARVFAVNSSRKAPYAAAGFAFPFHRRDLTGIRDKKYNLRTMVLADDRVLSVNPTVRFYFLSGREADYNGMARTYRRYLETEKGLKKRTESDSAPVSLAFYGRTEKQSRFLGIPVKKAVVATSFDQIAAFLEKSEINNPDIFLYGFEKGGYEKAYRTRITFDRRTGGKKGFERLLETTDGTVYTVVDLLRHYGGGKFGGDYVQSLNRLNVVRRRPLPSTGDWDFDRPAWTYKNQAALEKGVRKLLKTVPRAENAGVLLRRLGSEVPSDFNPKAPVDRVRAADAFAALLAEAAARLPAATDGGNVYAAPHAAGLTDAPVETGGDRIMSRSVPFYAMVLHGYVRLASEPLNGFADREAALSVLAAYGIVPVFRLTGASPAELTGTALDFLYDSRMDVWSDEIRRAAARYAAVQAGLANVPIASHAYEGTLEIVTYENGISLAVNRGETTVSFSGRQIGPKTVERFEKGERF